MSDKPKPGKDKDLRFIRQAMEATQRLLGLLAEQGSEAEAEQHARLLAEALLVTADQLDDLACLLANPTRPPSLLIDRNRELRRLVRLLLQRNQGNGGIAIMRMAEAVGSQLSALLVVQEIREPDAYNRPFSILPSYQQRRQGDDLLDQ